MGISGSCSNGLGQRLEELAKSWTGKPGWVETVSVLAVVPSYHLDGRTTSAATRKRRGPVVLEGGTGEITCTLTIGHHGEVEVRFDGLPARLCGTKPFLSFPKAASTAGIAWAPGPRRGIVHANGKVSTNGELRCLVARSRTKIDDLPRLFSQIGIFSEEGESQPACSLSIKVQRRREPSG